MQPLSSGATGGQQQSTTSANLHFQRSFAGMFSPTQIPPRMNVRFYFWNPQSSLGIICEIHLKQRHEWVACWVQDVLLKRELSLTRWAQLICNNTHINTSPFLALYTWHTPVYLLKRRRAPESVWHVYAQSETTGASRRLESHCAHAH